MSVQLPGPCCRTTCDALLDYADELHSVLEPETESLEDWQRWSRARDIRRHVASVLDQHTQGRSMTA